MLEGLKDALQYANSLKEQSMDVKVTEIAGKTYCNKELYRYGKEELATAIHASTLSSVVDYITNKSEELRESMILHITDPRTVKLYSGLLAEKRREYLFESEAVVNEFQFDKWYDQERFLIELQANFALNDDLQTIMKVAGNIKSGTTANYSDDGISQKTTIQAGVQRSDVIVPNPVTLVPYRTFPEIKQPQSQYVFRIRDTGGEPDFKLVEADNGLWKHEAMKEIKYYFEFELGDDLEKLNITVIA